MRNSEERFAAFAEWKPLTLVHRHCIEQPRTCEVRMSWDGDEPWMDTQDLQLFRSGDILRIRPTHVEAMFDGGETGPKLSDHDGFRVRYELSWPRELTPPSTCPIAGLWSGKATVQGRLERGLNENTLMPRPAGLGDLGTLRSAVGYGWGPKP
jgi:hypothetical protein